MKIEFKQDYIKRCYEAYQYSSFINPLMQNLEKGNSANVRSYMDASIDDLQGEINQIIGEGESSIHNARIKQLKIMYTSWYELLTILDLNDTSNYEIFREPSTEQFKN